MSDDRLVHEAHAALDTALRQKAAGDLDGASETLTSTLRSLPAPTSSPGKAAFAEMNFALGDIAERQGRDQEARDHFTQAVSIDPLMKRAALKVVEFAVDGADAHSASLAPHYVEYLSLGRDATVKNKVVSRLKEMLRVRLVDDAARIREKVPLLESVLREVPGATFARHFLGLAYYALGEFDAAIDTLRRLPEPAASDHTVQNVLGRALEKNGRLDEAYECYTASLQRKEDQPGIHFRIGRILVTRAHLG